MKHKDIIESASIYVLGMALGNAVSRLSTDFRPELIRSMRATLDGMTDDLERAKKLCSEKELQNLNQRLATLQDKELRYLHAAIHLTEKYKGGKEKT